MVQLLQFLWKTKLKESVLVKLAKYVETTKIAEELLLHGGCVGHSRRCNKIIMRVTARYCSQSHMFGIELLKIVKETQKIDERTGPDFWRRAIEVGMGNETLAFQFNDDEPSLLTKTHIDCQNKSSFQDELDSKGQICCWQTPNRQILQWSQPTLVLLVSWDSISLLLPWQFLINWRHLRWCAAGLPERTYEGASRTYDGARILYCWA